MSYIIVWRNSHRDPFVGTDMGMSGEFLETYSTYEQAKDHAEATLQAENMQSQSPWYFDYQIYEEATS